MPESNNSKKPLVSVIVVVHPTYLSLLKTALDSLKSQIPHELVLVLNNCYADIKGNKTIYIPYPATLAHACNVGISKCSGEYIVRLDADDWIDNQLLELERDYLDQHPEIDCVWCDYIEAKSHKKGEDFETFMLEHSPQHALEHACGAMYRKSVWQELGGYDPDLEYQEAFDFWCRFNQGGYKAERLEVPLYLYRKGHTSMSTNPERDAVRAHLENKYAIEEGQE